MARRTRRSRREADAHGFAWMLVGLGLGLLVAAGVYFSDFRADEGGAAPAAARTPRAEPAEEPAPAPARSRTGSSAESAAEAAAVPESESRFDFYDILPSYEVVVPEVESVSSTPAAAPAAVEAPGSYILQTGSFRSHGDADRMQANLALLGIESRIQKVTIDDDVYHRVRVGPISDLDQLNRLRAQLRGAGVDSLMMKVNE
ncbi:MAG: SPOR domain-containing protein [Gammaproteobacteria bacterium]|nr:SPOR domain-containing protein [Gammaproteobacteria bacterium]